MYVDDNIRQREFGEGTITGAGLRRREAYRLLPSFRAWGTWLSGKRGRGVQRGKRMKYLLLLAVCVIALWVPLYNFTDPALFGIPFFYWFQLLLVPLSALAIYFVDRLRKA